MGIPNLANRRSRGQERQSRCKLAMPNLAIHLGYHRPGGPQQPVAAFLPLPIPEFITGGCTRIARKVRYPDDQFPIRSSLSYSYAQLLS
jgi:hypothetical protein